MNANKEQQIYNGVCLSLNGEEKTREEVERDEKVFTAIPTYAAKHVK